MSGEGPRPLVMPAAPGPVKVVTRERLTAYDRWELPLLEERIQQAAEQLAGQPTPQNVEPLPTAGELQALQDRAYREGWQAGLEEGRAAVNSRLATLNKAIEQASGLLANTEATLAPRLLNLVVAMAREVIRAELKLQPESLLVVVREALAVMPSGTEAPNIHLHPDDVAWMRDEPSVNGAWQLVPDAGMARGSCRIELGESFVESELAGRWARVLKTIGRTDAWQDAAERDA
ncbi:MAG: FliH/SctL family protein [Burkholderiales bacterium]